MRVGCKFNINRDEVLNLLVNNKPNFQKTSNQLICGRVKLPLEIELTTKKDLMSECSFL
jgi:hypothetical protein